MKRTVWAVIIVIAIAVAGSLYTKYRIAPKVCFSAMALTDLDGKPFSMESVKGKKVLVNFFATWCGPCMGEMPLMQQAQEKLQSDGFVFLCISDEPLSKLRYLHDRLGISLTILHAEQQLSTNNIVTYPTNYLLNGDGEIVFKKTGILEWDKNETIEELRSKAR